MPYPSNKMKMNCGGNIDFVGGKEAVSTRILL